MKITPTGRAGGGFRLGALVNIIWSIPRKSKLCYNIPAYMRLLYENEVILIKRAVTFLLSTILILGLLVPSQARAATVDSSAGRVTTAGGRLNVRSGASTGAPAVAALHNGSYVTLISKSGSWWRVEYANGAYGYCHADYITAVPGSAATVGTQSSALNVRSGAGTSYPKLGSLPKGQVVIVLSTANGWSRILYHGTKTGYVSGQYLSAAAYPAVALHVPSFKQTDSRWANVTVGTSGKTIAQIGCATTAVAMLESYRTGGLIYPDAMSRQLTYTPTGSLYWPGDYVTVTDSAGYLSAVYARLRQGRPVLFGARNAAGKQHWVVITGYTGGNSLNAAGFTVNDPGSSFRTTLQQFLNAYPTFYKYFYYR